MVNFLCGILSYPRNQVQVEGRGKAWSEIRLVHETLALTHCLQDAVVFFP